MVILRRIAAFTLMESLVSGIVISLLGGIAMVIYLNIAASLTTTKDILIRTRARNQMDSLATVPGRFRLNYDFDKRLQVVFEKSIYSGDSNLLLISYELVDSLNVSELKLKRLKYE